MSDLWTDEDDRDPLEILDEAIAILGRLGAHREEIEAAMADRTDGEQFARDLADLEDRWGEFARSMRAFVRRLEDYARDVLAVDLERGTPTAGRRGRGRRR